MSEGKPLRLFVGVRVSLATVRALEEAVAGLRAAAGAVRLRWVPPSAYHVTLKFLGWTRPEAVEALRDRIGAALAGARALEVEVCGLGAFPSAARARILWAGVHPAAAGALGHIADRVDRAAAELGFDREKRAFHPHVTLARLREPGDLTRLVESASEQTYRTTWVDSVALFESRMKSDGSEYSVLHSWPLESDPKAPRRQTRPVEPEPESDSVPGGLRSEETGDGDPFEG